MTDTPAKFWTAFDAAYAEMCNPKKNATNPAFRSGYANLEEMLAVTKPVLTSHGLALVQEVVSEDGGVGVHTFLIGHGHRESFGLFVVPLAKKDAQGAGSAITYSRRYAIGALFGLAQEDDDGNAASAKPEEGRDYAGEVKALKADAVKNGSESVLNAKLGNPTTLKAAVAIYAAMSEVERQVLRGIADGNVETAA